MTFQHVPKTRSSSFPRSCVGMHTGLYVPHHLWLRLSFLLTARLELHGMEELSAVSLFRRAVCIPTEERGNEEVGRTVGTMGKNQAGRKECSYLQFFDGSRNPIQFLVFYIVIGSSGRDLLAFLVTGVRVSAFLEMDLWSHEFTV